MILSFFLSFSVFLRQYFFSFLYPSLILMSCLSFSSFFFHLTYFLQRSLLTFSPLLFPSPFFISPPAVLLTTLTLFHSPLAVLSLSFTLPQVLISPSLLFFICPPFLFHYPSSLSRYLLLSRGLITRRRIALTSSLTSIFLTPFSSVTVPPSSVSYSLLPCWHSSLGTAMDSRYGSQEDWTGV